MKIKAQKIISKQQILEFCNEEDMLFLLSILKEKSLIKVLNPVCFSVGGKYKAFIRLPCGSKDIVPIINEFCYIRSPLPYEKAYLAEYGKLKAI